MTAAVCCPSFEARKSAHLRMTPECVVWSVNGSSVVAATKMKKGPGAAARTLQSRERAVLLPGNLVVDALDVEVHAQDLTVGKMVAALALNLLAVLADNRTFERIKFACRDGGLGIFRHFLHVAGHVGVGRHLEHLAFEPAPGVLGFPGAVEL